MGLKERAESWLATCHVCDDVYCTSCELIRDLYEACYNKGNGEEADHVEPAVERSGVREGSLGSAQEEAGTREGPGSSGHVEGGGVSESEGEEVNDEEPCGNCGGPFGHDGIC